ncbi:MAG: adenine phosphoribosyltransferase, partial [Oscillospiraceae bacterium]
MKEFYTLEVAGLTRQLPICKINDNMDIAAFIMFSDVELTIACARDLLLKVPEFDVILTAEAKGIPLAYEMSRQSGKL